MEKGVKIGKKVVKAMTQETCMDDKIQEFKDYKKSLEKIKEILGKVTKKKKIILLIDELDRCKPLFAIKLLETIKHIFNVKDMSFVFALDMTQLSYSVEKVYGTKIDAAGYICRFFDYITKMPTPDTRTYITYLMEKKPLMRKIPYLKQRRGFYGEEIFTEEITFIDIFEDYVQKFQLSLRDINTIYSNFVILEERELKEIDNIEAYALYLFLLMVKYKNLALFNKIFIAHNYIVKDEPYLKEIQENEFFDSDAIENIKFNQSVCDIMTNRFGKSFRIEKERKEYLYKSGEFSVESGKYDNRTCLAECIFYPELDNYDKIKEMRIGDYIHKKLELFNFEWEKKQAEQEE